MLSTLGGRGRILAGGTDLVEKLREGNPGIDVFVDIRRIEEIKSIRVKQDSIVIGGGVTHGQVTASDPIKKHASVLAEACLVRFPLLSHLQFVNKPGRPFAFLFQ